MLRGTGPLCPSVQLSSIMESLLFQPSWVQTTYDLKLQAHTNTEAQYVQISVLPHHVVAVITQKSLKTLEKSLKTTKNKEKFRTFNSVVSDAQKGGHMNTHAHARMYIHVHSLDIYNIILKISLRSIDSSEPFMQYLVCELKLNIQFWKEECTETV